MASRTIAPDAGIADFAPSADSLCRPRLAGLPRSAGDAAPAEARSAARAAGAGARRRAGRQHPVAAARARAGRGARPRRRRRAASPGRRWKRSRPASRRPARRRWASVTLCHWQVGIDDVVLGDPAAICDRCSRDRDAAAGGHAPFFEEDGIALHAIGTRRAAGWRSGELFDDLATASLDRAIGQPISHWSPACRWRAAACAACRTRCRCCSTPHPRERRAPARGVPPINSFWLSGTGVLPASLRRHAARGRRRTARAGAARRLARPGPRPGAARRRPDGRAAGRCTRARRRDASRCAATAARRRFGAAAGAASGAAGKRRLCPQRAWPTCWNQL